MLHKKDTAITVDTNTYLYLVLLLLIVPIPWLLAWISAVLVHELCHCAAVGMCGGKIYAISIGIGGVSMESSPLSEPKRLTTVLAGPLGGFLPVLLGRWFPRFALCSAALSAYNLLPLLPLDGGQILQILMKNRKLFSVSQKIVLLLICILSLYAAFYLKIGILPLAIMGMLWLKNRKIPCNDNICRVQ